MNGEQWQDRTPQAHFPRCYPHISMLNFGVKLLSNLQDSYTRKQESWHIIIPFVHALATNTASPGVTVVIR